MKPHYQRILDTVEPLDDSIYGPKYRCSITLKDGTELPCAILQSKNKIVELAKRRIREEQSGRGRLGGSDPYGQIVSIFATGGNRINDYDVADATPSRFAPPLALLRQIHGETTMGWTGWVFEMSDGKLFPYGSSFSMEFFQIPDGYTFEDVAKVHNHSFLSSNGELRKLKQGGIPPEDYDPDKLFREKVYFTCAIEISGQGGASNGEQGGWLASLRTSFRRRR